MIYRLAFILLLLVNYCSTSTTDESGILKEKVIDKLLGEKIPTIRTTTEAGHQLYNKWLDQALSSLLAAFAQEELKSVSKRTISAHGKCSNRAETVKSHASCVVELMDAPRRDPKRIRFKEIARRKRNIGSYQRVIRTKYTLGTARDENVFNSVIQMVTGLVRRGKGRERKRSWSTIYSSLISQRREVERKRQMYDRLFPSSRRRDKPLSGDQKAQGELWRMIREGAHLGIILSGRKLPKDAKKTAVRAVSPRLLSLVPEEKQENRDVLSPSLFSLHGRGEGLEKEMSLHSLLGNVHRKAPDHFLEMMAEVTGISDTVEEAEEKLTMETVGTLTNSRGQNIGVSRENLTELYGEQGYRTLKVMERLQSSYSPEQARSLNSTGYTVMSNSQIEMVYGKGSPFEDKTVVERNQNLTKDMVKQEIRTAIRHLATGQATFTRRLKDHFVLTPLINAPLVASPSINTGLILSPVVIAPLVLSPALFGPVVLSPWLFVPLILSPRVLSPLVLSPFLFDPLILSPFLGNPVVLSPGVANPLILSPVVLSPIILSPQVMTPAILSPLALSPTILSPFTLSPFILSPFVLSPAIYSSPVSGGLILSPYALSPSIGSPPVGGGILFASPGFLS